MSDKVSDGTSGTVQPPPFEISVSRQFLPWLVEVGASLAFTTYQVGKVFWIGIKPDGRLELFNRTFNRSMGLYCSSQTLYLSTLYQLWRFENALGAQERHQGYDRMYVPQTAWTTGDVDIHDIALDSTGRPIFVSTLFSCLATTSETHSFAPLWKPPFISRLAAEDRCHMNGLAMVDGSPGFVTAVSRSDVADGWRERRDTGGVVLHVESGEVVLDGLSMPHSPRWHEGKLWVLDSGNGRFGCVDTQAGRFEEVAFCPGYARGLAFVGSYAVIGLSRPRGERGTFAGLALDEALAKRDVEARCGLMVVDLRTGDAPHWLRVSGVVEELYDVGVLPGAIRPMAIGLQSDEIRRVLSMAPGDAG
ncbi:MAG: TIGR03032 family protein [Pseudomonadota bacterium]